MISNRQVFILVALLFCSIETVSSARAAQSPKAVSGCELLRHPKRYNEKMVTVSGTYWVGFERENMTFNCQGSIGIEVSVYPSDQIKYGFLTDQLTLEERKKPLPGGPHSESNLTARKLFRAPVSVIGLFHCHHDFPTCKGASPDDGSIVVKSMQFNAPMSEVPPAAKPSTPGNTLVHESGHVDPPETVVLRRFQGLTRLCFPKVAHLACNQNCS
jgi:hypothetical protein